MTDARDSRSARLIAFCGADAVLSQAPTPRHCDVVLLRLFGCVLCGAQCAATPSDALLVACVPLLAKHDLKPHEGDLRAMFSEAGLPVGLPVSVVNKRIHELAP